MPSQYGNIERIRMKNGNSKYQITVWHDELSKHRVITTDSVNLTRQMAHAQAIEWSEQWQTKQQKAYEQAVRNEERATASATAAAEKRSREDLKRYQEEQKQVAAKQTTEAQDALSSLGRILAATLTVNDAIDWERLKDTSGFSEPKPLEPPPIPQPTPPMAPSEPKMTDARYKPQIGAMDFLIASRRKQKENEARDLFQSDHATWKLQCSSLQEGYMNALEKHKQRVKKESDKYVATMQKWEKDRQSFLTQQQEGNAAIDEQKSRYLAKDPETVVPYCDLVLSQSSYPDFMPNEWVLDYNSETKILVIDFLLPPVDALPTLSEIKYTTTKDEFTEKHIPAAQRDKLYDELLYQIVLRTIHELYEADVIESIDAVAFNGLVRSIDRATGNETTNCVLSLQAKRDEFLKINLAAVDPKACFRQLKGVGSSKLHSITPVAPIMQIRRDDGRFVASYEVAHQLDEGYNLASMNWEDFEHLIREVFEKEFATAGGEVRVTQASRDGGVDAVVFDPDPIRGGKIVIQAKRYTGTVGVSAVRDLYGTVMNEGANKGILVSTSDYGPDAYEFAKGKPISLLNGSNLLHLLEKNGHKARIDLQEARQLALKQRVCI